MAEETVVTKLAEKEPGPLLEAFTAWVAEETGYELDAQTVAIGIRLIPHFRASSAYDAAKDEIASKAAEDKAAKDARRRERESARLEKLREQQARVEARLAKIGGGGEDAPAPAPAPKAAPKAPAKKAAKPARKAAAKAPARKPAARPKPPTKPASVTNLPLPNEGDDADLGEYDNDEF